MKSQIMYSNNQISYNTHKRSVLSALKTTLLAASFSVFAACSGGGGGSEPAPIDSDAKAPSVTKVVPANGAKIAKNQTINITFSKNVKDVNNTNVSLIKSGAAASVALTIGGSGKVYTVKPNADLEAGASYTLTLKKAISDTAGNKLEADVSKTYTVSASSNPNPDPNPGGGDTTAPTISSLSPANNAIIGNASNKTPSITVNFSENVSNVNTDNVKFKQDATELAITIGGSGKTYTITPNADLAANKSYTLEFKAGIKDAAGNALVAVSKNYTTGDLVAPKLNSLTPADNSQNITVKGSLSLTFSKAVTGVTTANVLLSKSNTGSAPIALTLSGSGASYTFTPNTKLEYDTEYFILIKAANIKDAVNTPLGSANQVTRFRTYKQKVGFSAWLGSSDSKIDISGSLPSNSQLYSYRGTNYNDCNIANITACTNGQTLLLNGQTMTNTAHTLTQKAFYKLKEGSLVSTNSVENTERFTARIFFQAVVFKNKFWVIGGQQASASSLRNDVWSSDDGINWTQQSINGTHFSARKEHQVMVFQNKLWVIGGEDSNGYKNDVWSSTDGVNWTQSNITGTHFSARYGHKVVVFNNKLWLFGGRNGNGLQNDVWSSADGANWSQMSISGTYFSPRESQQVVVANIDGSNKLWVIGGYGSSAYLNDVWSSDNGVNWTRVLARDHTASPGGNQFPLRSGHQVVVANIDGSNKLWVIGGYRNSVYLSDVWSSTDGQSWSQTAINGTHFLGLSGHQVVVRNNKLLLLGGSASSGAKNDVWRSSDGATWRKGYSGEITRP